MFFLKTTASPALSIFIFPEGTFNETNNALKDFYDGAFRIAIEAQQPVLPMVIIGAGKLMPPRQFIIRPGRIKIRVLPEISTAGMGFKDLPALKEKVITVMTGAIKSDSNR